MVIVPNKKILPEIADNIIHITFQAFDVITVHLDTPSVLKNAPSD